MKKRGVILMINNKISLRDLYYRLLNTPDRDEFIKTLRESRCPKKDAYCELRTHKTKDSKM